MGQGEVGGRSRKTRKRGRRRLFIERSPSAGAGKKNETYPSSLELQKSPITFSFFGSEV
jgi:hypothetical protein